MKKFTRLFSFAVLCISLFSLFSCENEDSMIGGALTTGEVTISIDTIIYNLNAQTVEITDYDAKTGNLLLGNINTSEYGALDCAFVSRLLCVPDINVPDSLLLPERVDSCKVMINVMRGSLTGDSLAPQKLSVYLLNKQLPNDLTNQFNPTDYFDSASPLGSVNYTLSNISGNDTVFLKRTYIPVDVDLPVSFGKDIFDKYKNEPDIFQWPASFAKYIPGIYIRQTFGKGCVANIQSLYFTIYYHSKALETTTVEDETVTKLVNKKDSIIPFTISPEVLSSNIISYKPSQFLKDKISQGETILTTPGGYQTSFKFPAKELIEQYINHEHNLSTINNLTLSIPGEAVKNSLGISYVPNLLLIKTSEMEDFFTKGKVPDNLNSFIGSYDPNAQVYNFTSLRPYINNLVDKGEITEEDESFTIIPVEITTESGSSGYSTVSVITKCVPYNKTPTMTRLYTERASIIFSFSSQLLD